MTTPLLPTPLPIIAAPMAGGPSTIALARAVADAGGFPFLPAGYKTPGALEDEITQMRATGAPFGVNLFVPSPPLTDRTGYDTYVAELAPEAERQGVELPGEPITDDDHWDAKLALLREDPVPLVSFTFGLPPAAVLASLRACGSRTLVTVTTPAEALAATAQGADGLVVQGPDAGGHSAIHDPTRTPQPITLPELLRQVQEVTGLPLIAAGGINGPAAVQAALDAGATAVAVGTLLLRTPEAGTSAIHRAALADPQFTRTAITRAFTGRPARALMNGFIAAHGAAAPTGYPAVHHLTKPLRSAAAASGDAHGVHLWAGTGWRSAREASAREVIRSLAP